MKVLLINVPYKEVYAKVPTTEGATPPLGLAYIAAYIRKNGHTVKIIDAEANEIGMGDIQKYISSDFDVVGVPSMTPTLNNSVEVLRIAKKINPSCIAIMGGPHISAIPYETLQEYPVIDIGVIGEGEITFLEVLNVLNTTKDLSSVKGIVFRNAEKIQINEARPLIENLDDIPFPAYDLLPMEKYRPPAYHANFSGNFNLTPFSMIITSRGCPFNCTFCASKVVWGRTVRFRSAENVLKEIDMLVNTYKVKCLNITDDIFVLNPKRMNEILDGLIKRDYELHFSCLNRVDKADEESFIRLKKAGCYLMRFGVESGSQKILTEMHKNITPDQIKEAFCLAAKVGIPASANFIIGHPGETEETFKETLKISKEIDACLAYFFIVIPIIGTELNTIVQNKKLIVNPSWKEWIQMPEKPVIRTESLSTDDLLRMRRQAYHDFYLRPSYIFKNLIRIRTLEQIKFYMRGALGVLNMVRK